MAERAARWVDEVFPRVAVRQWVFTVPWPRRWLLARRPELARGVLAIGLREIGRWYRKACGQPGGQTGSITAVQRFGSALNLNLHFHALVLDGIYAKDSSGGRPRWHRAPAPTTEEVESLVVEIATKAEAWLARQGFGPADDEEVDPEDVQAVLQAAAVAGRSALNQGRRVRRVQVLGGRPFQLPPRCANCDGYGLHAGVVIGAGNRKGLERLSRYVCRPPLAKARLEEREDGSLVVTLKRPWSDGTTAVVFSRLELLERLAALVPPPRANQILYHGVLAARSSLRPAVVVGTKRRQRAWACAPKLTRTPSPDSRWVPWAWLLQRVFEVEAFACPRCERWMTLRAIVLSPTSLDVLASLARSARAPPPAPGVDRAV